MQRGRGFKINVLSKIKKIICSFKKPFISIFHKGTQTRTTCPRAIFPKNGHPVGKRKTGTGSVKVVAMKQHIAPENKCTGT